jgi:hypothetical protein
MINTATRLTVLTTLGINAVKTYKMVDGKLEVEGYGRAKKFTASEIDVDDEGKWLERLRRKTESFVVMGAPRDWKKGEKKRRLSTNRDDQDATIVDVPRGWMPIDVDQVDFEPMGPVDDGEMFARELLDRLKLRDVRCVWHLTNSHGFFGKYRARLWVQLADSATCEQMKAFATARWGELKVNVDGKAKGIVDMAVYRPAQPIYTGDPILEDGIEDPVRRRVGIVEGDALEMELPKSQRKKRGAPGDDNVAKLEEAGLYISRLKPGQHCMRCPWEDSHSGAERDDDTFYFEPYYNGHDIPAFKCHHADCEKRQWADVLEWMGEEAQPEETEKAPNWVFVRRFDQFWDARDGALVDTKVYDSTHGGRRKNGTPTEIFMKKESGLKVDIAEFLPGKERVVKRGRLTVLNTYVDQRTEPDASIDVTPWTDHLAWVVPDKEDREQLMDWLAWSYQNPGHKITWAPIMYSKSFGVGKTTVFNCLAECLGKSLVSEPTQAELEDKFNDWCYGKVLVKIEELMSGDKFHVAEKLKPVVANPSLSIRRMHQTGFSVENVANVCASTNHMQALPIEEGDRRWMLIQCVEAEKDVRRPRMKAFHRWLAEVGHGGIAFWLSERDVSSFIPTSEAPDTRLKDLVIQASMTDFDRAVDLCATFDGERIVSSSMMSEFLAQNECSVKGQRLGLIAARRGWKTLPGREARTMVGNRKLSFWTPEGNILALRAFLAKKPGDRERAHSNLAAKLVFGSSDGEK